MGQRVYVLRTGDYRWSRLECGRGPEKVIMTGPNINCLLNIAHLICAETKNYGMRWHLLKTAETN